MKTLKLTLKHGAVGPAHDPYSSLTLTATNPINGFGAEWYEDGLGTRRIALWVMNDKEERFIREESWVDGATNAERIAANAIRHFQAWIGFSPGTLRDEAEKREAAMEPDPMGHPSSHI